MAVHPSVAGREATVEQKPNLTPLIDVCFLLITFFILIMTIAKDENAKLVVLPKAQKPPIDEDEQVPNSLNINVDPESRLWGWGNVLDLRDPSDFEEFRDLVRSQSNVFKQQQQQRGSDWQEDGLDTTLIIRVSSNVEFEIFQQIMDVCREFGFTKYQLKASREEDNGGAT